MLQEEYLDLSYGQQVAVTISFVSQCLIVYTVALLTTQTTERATEVDIPPKIYLPVLHFITLIGSVIGAVLVIAMWRRLGGLSLEFWADCGLSAMLLWAILVEVRPGQFSTCTQKLNSAQDVLFTGLAVNAFGDSSLKGQVIKRILQMASIVGIALIAADMVFRGSPQHLLTLGAALHRGSLALGFCIIRIESARRTYKLSTSHWRTWVCLDIRSVCELITFGLSFLSFCDRLTNRVSYKLVRSPETPSMSHNH